MVVKIQPPNPNVMAAIRYNEKKAKGEAVEKPEDPDGMEAVMEGRIVATRNVPEATDMSKEFERLQILNIKKRHSGPVIRNYAFHMSVNPSETDRKMTDDEAVAFIDEMMRTLGYGDQPYRIYKHTDIPRQHYHVVSTRAGKDGKKVDDSFERLKLRRFLKANAEKYGYEVILNDYEMEREGYQQNAKEKTQPETEKKHHQEEQKTTGKSKSRQKTVVPPYDKTREEPTGKQLRDAAEDAILWHFSTLEQLQNILRLRYNAVLEIENDTKDGKLKMGGLDKSGEVCTPIIGEDILGTDLIKRINDKINKEKMHNRREQRERLEKVARAAAKEAKSYEEFRGLMEKKGIWTVLSWKESEDELFGITYLDRATRCAWKGSETMVNLAWFQQLMKEKGWTPQRDSAQEKSERRNRKESTSKSRIPREDIHPFIRQEGPARLNLRRFGTGGQASSADVTKGKDEDFDNKEKKNVDYIGE